ncbi:MAG: hypothetical protein QOH68_1980, partial [Nocardioidaceae bacterium]|nr:hypothetical protein [Nocardioidaceae bacterium]
MEASAVPAASGSVASASAVVVLVERHLAQRL